jgi:hypothetical protein
MRSTYKSLILGGVLTAGISGWLWTIHDVGKRSAFREGLRVKFEEVADSNKDGKLSVEEMVSVCNTLNVDPSKQLYNGFGFTVGQRQEFLKIQGQFNPETDADYNKGKPKENFERAIAQGKYVYRPSF